MRRVIGFVLLLCAQARPAAGQDVFRERGVQLLLESRYAEAERVFAEWVSAEPRSPDAQYFLAVSLASQGKATEARTGFRGVLALDSRRADAHFEMAATYLKSRDYAAALDWATRGLRRAPDDEYGLDLTGTILFVSGIKTEAFRYWNRLGRPSLTEIRIRTSGGVTRGTVASEIALAPGDLLTWTALEQARWRLGQHKYLRSVVFEPVPGPTPQQYSLDVIVDARHGVGSAPEFLFATLADVWFRTLRINYWNVGHSGVSLMARWRWLPAAQRASIELDVPRPAHLPWYLGLSTSWRDESWSLRAPDAGFRVRANEAAVTCTFPIQPPYLSLAATLAGRSRQYETLGSARGDGLAGDARPDERANRDSRGVIWLRAVPRLAFSVPRIAPNLALRSQVRAGFEAGWARGRTQLGLSRLWISSEARIERSHGGGPRQSMTLGLHAGRMSTNGPAEDHFVLGVGPDTDFALRAHPYLRNAGPGSAPLAGEFLLANVTAAADLATLKWLKVGAVVFADVARAPRLYAAQAVSRNLLDAGIGIELGSALFSSRRVTLAWGRDWKGRHNAFYVASSFR